MPTPSGLVVKNWSKTWSMTAPSMPGPVSMTSTSTTACRRTVRMNHLAAQGARLGHGLHGIAHEVADHLLDHDGIGPDPGQLGPAAGVTTVSVWRASCSVNLTTLRTTRLMSTAVILGSLLRTKSRT
jgi:hypothetical protein